VVLAWISDSQELELEAEQAKEVKLREDYKVKLTKAVNLDVLKKQREQVLQYVTQLEKQLPSKAEMDALVVRHQPGRSGSQPAV
jgi:type IV pilus assembly protein PilO